MIKKNYFKASCRILFFPLAFPYYLGKYNNAYPNDTIKQAWDAFKWTLSKELSVGISYEALEKKEAKEQAEAQIRKQKLRKEMQLATNAEFVEVE